MKKSKRRRRSNKHKGLFLCFYCGKSFPSARVTRDHLLPKSRGGGNDGNLVKACKPCNNDKAGLTLDEYRLVVAFRRGLIQESNMIFPGEVA